MAKQSYNMFGKRNEVPQKSNWPDNTNPQLQWKAYLALEKQVNEAWAKLQNDVKRRANPQVLQEDKNRLMLLLGECNYLARECIRWIDHPLPQKAAKPAKSKGRKKRR